MEDYKKKYKEALGRANAKIETYNHLGNASAVKSICEIFPELRESEDERIRKALIELVQGIYMGCCTEEAGKERDMFLAWLEKQGEQKPEIKYIYPKFRVGDVIEPAKPNGYCVPVRVKYIGDGSYSCESDDHKSFLSFPVCNENEYVLTEQHPAWSEEDKAMVEDIIEAIDTQYEVTDYNEMVNWLKSIKERYTWKPSDEQMEALWDSIPENVKEISEREMLLDSLYQDLKKLRKE